METSLGALTLASSLEALRIGKLVSKFNSHLISSSEKFRFKYLRGEVDASQIKSLGFRTRYSGFNKQTILIQALDAPQSSGSAKNRPNYNMLWLFR